VKERKDRVDDALHATRAAVEEGIIAGGGAALLYATKALKDLEGANDDQDIGIEIVRRAIQAPIRQIAENAGDEGSVVVNTLLAQKDNNFGYNAQSGEYTDLREGRDCRPCESRSRRAAGCSIGCGPSHHHRSHHLGQEIDALISFIAGIKSVPLDGPAKRHLPDSILRDIVLDQSQARKLFSKNPEVFLQLAQHEDVARDVVAVGYRRKKLKYFEQLLSDPQYFLDELLRLNCKPEALWQKFFEANTWIFGYGLSYQFLSELDGHRLEQVVRGSDLAGRGKRSDAVMKTRGLISSMCFVEIKRHDTSLLDARQYRPSVWSPSSELIGGISQIQKTVHSAIESIGRTLRPADAGGTPTGEVLFNIEPRSILVIGSLKEFQSDRGLNEQMFGSFELFRRNTWRPEIVTFDELLERARFIVEHEPAVREAD
jgi:hypothetical protein